jgi:hypothetical protein
MTITTATMITIGQALTAATLTWGAYELAHHVEFWVDSYQSMNQSELDEIGKKDGNQQGQDSKKEQSKKPPRTEPKDLAEEITLQEAKGGAGDTIMKDKINDPRYPPDKWEKKQHEHINPDGTKINVHYWEEIATKERHGFKFKND